MLAVSGGREPNFTGIAAKMDGDLSLMSSIIQDESRQVSHKFMKSIISTSKS